MFSVSSLQGSPQISDEEFLSQGLNEFIDPAESPIYTQDFTTITFKESISLEDLEKFNTKVPLFIEDSQITPTIHTKLGIIKNEIEQTTPIQVGKTLLETKNALDTEVQSLQSKGEGISKEKRENPQVSSITLNHESGDKNIVGQLIPLDTIHLMIGMLLNHWEETIT